MGKGMIDISPPFSPPKGSFQKELESLINRQSIEGGSNTPDFILAEYLRCCLDSFDMVTRRRDEWYGYKQACNKVVEDGQAKHCDNPNCEAADWPCTNWNRCRKYTPAT